MNLDCYQLKNNNRCRHFLNWLFWVAFLKQSLNSSQVAELKGNKRKFKEDFGRKRKKDVITISVGFNFISLFSQKEQQ
jgi:hypothetical protein